MCPCWETALPSKGAVGAGWKTAAVIDNERDWAGLLLLLWKSEPEVFWIRHRWSLCLLGWEIITYIMAKGGSLWLLARRKTVPTSFVDLLLLNIFSVSATDKSWELYQTKWKLGSAGALQRHEVEVASDGGEWLPAVGYRGPHLPTSPIV